MKIVESGVSAIDKGAGEKKLLARPKQNLTPNEGEHSS